MKFGTSKKQTVPADTGRPGIVRSKWLARLRVVLVAVGALAVAGSPWWGPRLLTEFEFFNVRRVEFRGLRYTRPGELMALLDVDTLQSVWQALEPLADRVSTHPLVLSAVVTRHLPSTLLVRVAEREPVALAPDDGTLAPVDGEGMVLPIDPSRMALDLPIAASADTLLLHVLSGLRQDAPDLYGRVTWAARVGPDELQFLLGSVSVRTTADVTVTRFRDILPVEADLARNAVQVEELDLRFRDQVIARQP